MLQIPTLTDVTAWHFPDDKVAGKEAFLGQWDKPVEMWIRAYALTMRELVDVSVRAAKLAPQHFYVDKSQYQAEAEMRALCKELVETPGVDLTIGTSREGQGFIAHSKSTAGADGRAWLGSWNFSESASRQVNDALQFNSPEWRDSLIAAFRADVAWAWQNERAVQIMATPPSVPVEGEREGKPSTG